MAASSMRSVDSYDLAPSIKSALAKAGYMSAGDFDQIGPVKLAQQCGISHKDALAVLDTICGSTRRGIRAVSAYDILEEERKQTPIVTFCQEIDGILGGGVPIGKVVEFCGAPGLGKTQLSMQLACDVRIPECFGGVGGEALCIDTEGSFVIERLVEIGAAVVRSVQQQGAASDEVTKREAGARFTLEHVLRGIHYFRVHTYVEQLALINLLPSLIRTSCPNVRCVIIDSICFAFRHDFADNMNQRTRILTGMAQKLHRLADTHSVAVVMTNQVTTRGIGSSTGAFIAPALGELWGHAAAIRISLYWRDGIRWAHLFKSPALPSAVVPYAVTSDGVRRYVPVPADDDRQRKRVHSDETDAEPSPVVGHEPKRARPLDGD